MVMSHEEIPLVGVRTLRYFFVGLAVIVMLYVLGVVLGDFYDFGLLEQMTAPVINDPMILMPIAAVVSVIVGGFIVWRFIQEQSGHKRIR